MLHLSLVWITMFLLFLCLVLACFSALFKSRVHCQYLCYHQFLCSSAGTWTFYLFSILKRFCYLISSILHLKRDANKLVISFSIIFWLGTYPNSCKIYQYNDLYLYISVLFRSLKNYYEDVFLTAKNRNLSKKNWQALTFCLK